MVNSSQTKTIFYFFIFSLTTFWWTSSSIQVLAAWPPGYKPPPPPKYPEGTPQAPPKCDNGKAPDFDCEPAWECQHGEGTIVNATLYCNPPPTGGSCGQSFCCAKCGL